VSDLFVGGTLEVGNPMLERELADLPVGQPTAALVVPDDRVRPTEAKPVSLCGGDASVSATEAQTPALDDLPRHRPAMGQPP